MFEVDLAIYDRKRQLVLTVEAKRLTAMDRQWAQQLRRNLIAHGYPAAPYFLLATPDKFFLWSGDSNSTELTEPDYLAESSELLNSIYPDYGTTPGEASSFIFEQVVSRWLRSIVYSNEEYLSSLPAWIRESGLAEAINQGDFQFEIAA